MQTAFGELHDRDLLIADLGARLDRRRAKSNDPEGDADARTRVAALWPLSHFTKERGRHFRRALARWQKWGTGGFFERMSELLGEQRTGGRPNREAQR